MKVIVKGTIESSKDNLNLFMVRKSNINLSKILNIFNRVKKR